MAYQTLYRAFRLQTFSEMVGQEAIVRALSNQVMNKHIAHAYLFCGSHGTGKTSAARIMSMAINCQNPKDGNPCLECEHCKALKSETTLDVFEMDAASNSRVEEIREMLARTDYPPQFVPYKVYIIDEVHMLSNAAFNALLKTLEEPPPYMVFILATTEPQKLPATILSRCQRYDFGRIPEDEIIKRLKVALKDGLEADEEALRLIAASAQGAMRDAWSLMDMCLGATNRLTEENVRRALGAVSQDFLFDFLDALLKSDTGAALQLVDRMMKDGRDVTVFLREFNAHLRQVLAVKWTGRGSREVSGDQLKRLKKQAGSASGSLLLSILEKCMKSEQDARWSSSQRAVLELFVLRCAEDPGQPFPIAETKPTPVLREDTGVKAAPEKTRTTEAKISLDEVMAKKPESKADEHRDEVPPGREPDIKRQDATAPQKEEMIPSLVTDEEVAGTAPAGANGDMEAVNTAEEIDEPTSPAGQPLSSSPKAAWNNLLKRLQKDHPPLYSFVNRGKYGGYENQEFTLLMGEGDGLFISMLNEAERAEPISRILSEEMGAQVRFIARNKDEKSADAKKDEVEEQIDALAKVFGRDKIVLKND